MATKSFVGDVTSSSLFTQPTLVVAEKLRLSGATPYVWAVAAQGPAGSRREALRWARLRWSRRLVGGMPARSKVSLSRSRRIRVTATRFWGRLCGHPDGDGIAAHADSTLANAGLSSSMVSY